ncbi:HNH endonuclease signature motif containing protein [Pseudonocardia sp. H11422]|uniref:HNH endonuclease signature motif containing protein n=1 Tax=Pseudonocardia sp. H11422 TaxID=2835866 RepID=UPI001BDC8A20|nr:HNH endonuclease signature motif containing protein [Pseudonocardia sp. H11422]
MSDSALATAHRLLIQAVDELCAAAGSGASDAELLAVLTLCEGMTRRLDRLAVGTVSTLERRGSFAERGYKSTAGALGDLLGWERFEARRRVIAAEQVCPRVGLDGTPRPARLGATSEVFAAGQASLRHVEVIARVLGTAAAERLTPDHWAGVEAQLAAKTADYTPTELQTWGTALVDALDQDGPEPDDRPPAPVNELHLTRNPNGTGGKIKGRFDDATMFDAIAAVIDAHANPLTGDDDRTAAQRQAEALADVCTYVLDHGDVPDCGGHRPHLNVLIRLEDLENRCRAAVLDFGGTSSPESLRLLACDAAVVPIVLDGTGQPLDVGRLTRTIPDGLRRAVAARDRGCAHPGCNRPPSWCEVHHIREWHNGGETKVDNLVMLCRVHHRQIHHSEWIVRIRDGLPEFIPPAWIDPERRPRRKALPHLAA